MKKSFQDIVLEIGILMDESDKLGGELKKKKPDHELLKHRDISSQIILVTSKIDGNLVQMRLSDEGDIFLNRFGATHDVAEGDFAIALWSAYKNYSLALKAAIDDF